MIKILFSSAGCYTYLKNHIFVKIRSILTSQNDIFNPNIIGELITRILEDGLVFHGQAYMKEQERIHLYLGLRM